MATSLCCLPFWNMWVSMTDTNDDCDIMMGCLCCCTGLYCFCGDDKEDRILCCTAFWEQVDYCIKWTCCCPCACYNVSREEKLKNKKDLQILKNDLELKILESKQLHELEILKIKALNVETNGSETNVQVQEMTRL